MIGTPEDKLEKMFQDTLKILEICGSIIPKPFTPNLGSRITKKYLVMVWNLYRLMFFLWQKKVV